MDLFTNRYYNNLYMDISYDYTALNPTEDSRIAFFQRREDVMPYPQYNSGARTMDNAIYTDKMPPNSNPVLRLEYDILNKKGFGLKKGFYEIRPDNEFTSLMFIQSGKILAKIPVIKKETISEYGNDYEWADKKDKKNQPEYGTSKLTEENTIVSPTGITPTLTEKQRKKRYEKYKRGEDPIGYIHSTVEMKFDRQLNLYIIVWEKYNTRVIGVFKLK